MEEYLNIKEQAVLDSKEISFEGMDNSTKLNAALVKLKEKDIPNTKGQMVYVSNLLIPDDEEFLNNYKNDKSIKSLAGKYGVPDYVINIKVLGIQDKLNKQDSIKEENTITEDIVPEEIAEIDQNPQKKETIEAITGLEMFFKKAENQEEELESLRKQVDDLKKSNDELNKKNNSLNDDIENAKKEKEELELDIRKKNQTIEDLNKTVEGLEKEVDNLTDTLQQKNEEVDKLNITNESLKKQITSVQNENESLKEKTTSLETYKNDYDTIMSYLNQNLQKDDQRLAS